MAVPGFSLSELARAIKNAYEISQELKDAPKELESIVEGVQFGRSFLEELRRHVPKGNEKLYEESHPLLVHVYREYDLILKKLDTFIRKHGKLAGGGLRARVKWVVDKHLVETCEDLKSKLRAVEQRGTLALSLSNYDISRETKTRNDSIVSPAHPAYITQLSHSPELLPQDSAASQSRNPLTPVTPIRIRNGSALLNDSQDLSPISPNEPNPSSGHYDNASPSRTNSSPNWPESPRSNTTNEQFQNTYNITADIVAVTGRNAAQQWPTRTVRASTASTAVTVTPSVFSVPSNRSSVSTVDMTQEFMSPISPTQLQTKRSPSTESSPIPGRQSRSNTFLSGGGSSTPRALVAVDKNPPSGPASEHSILISQNTSCRINVLLEGEVKVCYTAGRERTWKTVTSIDIERSNTGSDLKICLKTKDGIDRIHRG
ncbi:hypothetical protein K432DRAFT_33954 [Lepidopterella palustris CBS 459.81]|uniref:Uncharacterized protein n=1 Tax=Lepidopterella palustris CBS 459.81 TaxID=1314670 RepID=A0A8E2EKH3_9PEZI|nr:hypothetical protein K432DRAFT_33954 [Lepidopterella palustris CBS 459.81]